MSLQFRQPVTVHRMAIGTYLKGEYTEGAASTITIMASVQPDTRSAVEPAAEGRDNRKVFKLYTDTKLRLVTEANPDRVVLFGEEYEVASEAIWQNNVINHYKYTVVEIE